MRLRHSTAFLITMLCSTCAWSGVFKCVDADGRVTYTNDQTLARKCEPLNTDQPVSSVPAPRRSNSTTSTSRPASSAGFPSVSREAQRTRDETRRQILESELATEEESLSEAQKALSEQEAIRMGDEKNYQKVLDRLQPFKDAVELHQRNVDALQRELRTLK